MSFAEGKRIIGAESDPPGAAEIDEKALGIGIVNEGIDVEVRGFCCGRQIAARGCLIVDGAEIGTNMKGVLDATNRKRKRAASMGEGDPEFRKSRENAAENHRANGE